MAEALSGLLPCWGIREGSLKEVMLGSSPMSGRVGLTYSGKRRGQSRERECPGQVQVVREGDSRRC